MAHQARRGTARRRIRHGCPWRHPSRVHPRHRCRKILLGTRPARRLHAGAAVQRGDAEAGIVGQRRQTAARAAASALTRVADEVGRVLGRFGQAELAGEMTAPRVGAADGELGELRGLWLARTAARHRRAGERSRRARRPRAAPRTAWRRRARQAEHAEELRLGDRCAPRCPGSRRCRRCRSARSWRRISRSLRVVEIEHGLAAADSARHGGDLADQRQRLDHVHPQHCRNARSSATEAPVIAAQRVPPSAFSTSQSRRGTSPICERSTTARSARPIRRWISCVCPTACRVRPRARRVLSRARQHAVFRGHPALAGVAHERRHTAFHAGGAEHLGVAHADQAGTFGMA